MSAVDILKTTQQGTKLRECRSGAYWSDLENTTELSVCLRNGSTSRVGKYSRAVSYVLEIKILGCIAKETSRAGYVREMLWCCTVFLGDLDCARQSSTRRKLISCDHHFYANDSSIDKCQ